MAYKVTYKPDARRGIGTLSPAQRRAVMDAEKVLAARPTAVGEVYEGRGPTALRRLVLRRGCRSATASSTRSCTSRSSGSSATPDHFPFEARTSVLHVNEAITSRLVEQALPLLPFACAPRQYEHFTYDELEERRRENSDAGHSDRDRRPPAEWRLSFIEPFIKEPVGVDDEDVRRALHKVVFADRGNGPWDQANAEAQDWLFGPRKDSTEDIPGPATRWPPQSFW
ncbi:hypothetical protein [Streptomyces hainanensis]|uniref:Uncharacterized protein n=1 Tax=Streptomyces hainanensis TaxID=402648 RepID=A0A4R4SDY6_9ACTN|nr:hypothetical protein [Streptomyces hainanensis]TDC61471.1 hypothetical protein E1283_35405 [Streptomyces hainanensis]